MLAKEDCIEAETAITVERVREKGFGYDGCTSADTVYNYFRDYDPQTGRFIQSDPIGLLGGLNTYLYVAGDPLRQIDPFGLMGEIPRSPEDALRRGPKEIGSSTAAKLYGQARGMQCAQNCDRLKGTGSLTTGLAAIDICNELMPWLQYHPRGSEILDACVETCVKQYPKVCSQKTGLVCP